MPVWVLILVAFFFGCFVAFGLLVWVSGRLDKDLTGLDFDTHVRDAIELGDGTR